MQVCLLSEGHLMYFGAPDEAADWFATQGYMYHPTNDGLVSDWMLDLVSTSFYKPSKPKVRMCLSSHNPSMVV